MTIVNSKRNSTKQERWLKINKTNLGLLKILLIITTQAIKEIGAIRIKRLTGLEPDANTEYYYNCMKTREVLLVLEKSPLSSLRCQYYDYLNVTRQCEHYNKQCSTKAWTLERTNYQNLEQAELALEMLWRDDIKFIWVQTEVSSGNKFWLNDKNEARNAPPNSLLPIFNKPHLGWNWCIDAKKECVEKETIKTLTTASATELTTTSLTKTLEDKDEAWILILLAAILLLTLACCSYCIYYNCCRKKKEESESSSSDAKSRGRSSKRNSSRGSVGRGSVRNSQSKGVMNSSRGSLRNSQRRGDNSSVAGSSLYAMTDAMTKSVTSMRESVKDKGKSRQSSGKLSRR